MSRKKLQYQQIIFRLKEFLVNTHGEKFKQKNISEITKIDEATISRLLKMNQDITLDKILKIYEGYGLNLHWLLTGEDKPSLSEQPLAAEPLVSYGKIVQSEFSSKFWREIRRIADNHELQGQIIQLIKSELGNEGGKERASIIDEHQGGSAIKEAPT